MEYYILRQCDAGEKGDLSDFGWSQARYLAEKLREELGVKKVVIFSQDKKAAQHTAGIIASKFGVTPMPDEELYGEEYFNWLEHKVKSLNGDSPVHIFIVNIETILYFPKERLGIGKYLVRPGRGIYFNGSSFESLEYEF
jgi:hypothetical protein